MAASLAFGQTSYTDFPWPVEGEILDHMLTPKTLVILTARPNTLQVRELATGKLLCNRALADEAVFSSSKQHILFPGKYLRIKPDTLCNTNLNDTLTLPETFPTHCPDTDFMTADLDAKEQYYAVNDCQYQWQSEKGKAPTKVWNNTQYLFRLDQAKPLLAQKTTSGMVESVRFSAKGKYLVLGENGMIGKGVSLLYSTEQDIKDLEKSIFVYVLAKNRKARSKNGMLIESYNYNGHDNRYITDDEQPELVMGARCENSESNFCIRYETTTNRWRFSEKDITFASYDTTQEGMLVLFGNYNERKHATPVHILWKQVSNPAPGK